MLGWIEEDHEASEGPLQGEKNLIRALFQTFVTSCLLRSYQEAAGSSSPGRGLEMEMGKGSVFSLVRHRNGHLGTPGVFTQEGDCGDLNSFPEGQWAQLSVSVLGHQSSQEPQVEVKCCYSHSATEVKEGPRGCTAAVPEVKPKKSYYRAS